VQFVHRMMAYALFAVAGLHAIDAWRSGSGAARGGATLLAAAVTVQAGLGIATLLGQVPIGLALAHQGMAVVTLAIAVVHAERLSPRAGRQHQASPAPA